jgi:hypothetical protein
MEFITQYAIEMQSSSISIYHDGKEIAYFTIYENPYSVSISTGDFQGKGLARQMIKLLCEKVNLPEDTLIYVDTDASNGFWEAVGFISNPHYDTKDEGGGYELVIKFGQLLAWASCS